MDDNVEIDNSNHNDNLENVNDNEADPIENDNKADQIEPEIQEEILINDGSILEDPNFIIGKEISSFQNDNPKLSYRRMKFKKYEWFNVTDYNFSLKIDFKKKYQDVLMTTVLDGFLNGLKKVFERAKRDFRHNLYRFSWNKLFSLTIWQ